MVVGGAGAGNINKFFYQDEVYIDLVNTRKRASHCWLRSAAVTLIQSKCKTMARVTVIHHIVSLSPSVLVYYLFISVSGLKT